jgi:hypothetical protein
MKISTIEELTEITNEFFDLYPKGECGNPNGHKTGNLGEDCRIHICVTIIKKSYEINS